MSRVTENQFLGALLGVAIGDALGLPVRGMAADSIREQHGEFETYLEIEDAGDGQPISGTISDATEVVLCIVESLTTNDGILDPENINARLGFLVRGASRQWMSDATASGVDLAGEHDGLVPEGTESEPEAVVALRGVPVGLLHSIGAWDEDSIAADAGTVTRLTHGGKDAIDLTRQVTIATAHAARSARGETDRTIPVPENEHPLAQQVAAVIEEAMTADSFEGAVLPVVRAGGDAAALGAIAGGIAGARFGASGIPQHFIDGLDARIYLSMAAPWYYRTVLRRAGTVIDLRLDGDQYPQY